VVLPYLDLAELASGPGADEPVGGVLGHALPFVHDHRAGLLAGLEPRERVVDAVEGDRTRDQRLEPELAAQQEPASIGKSRAVTTEPYHEPGSPRWPKSDAAWNAKPRKWQALRDEEARSAQTESEEDGRVELLDAETSVSSLESAEAIDVGLGDRSAEELLKRVEDSLQDERGMIVDAEHGRLAPPGSVSEPMNPDMAAAVEEELNRQARRGAELALREADREEYLHQLRSRR